METKKSIFQKLQEAREVIKQSKLKKAGTNTYSKYDYFTPEQVNQLVYEAEKKTGLFHKFDLVRSETGLHGRLVIISLETNENTEFIQATDIPSITATNIAQQIGGAVTYTNRYMLMTAFDIVDNNADFDSHDNRKQPEKQPEKKYDADEKKWLNPGTTTWASAVAFLKQEGNVMADILKKYNVSKINQDKLMEEAI